MEFEFKFEQKIESENEIISYDSDSDSDSDDEKNSLFKNFKPIFKKKEERQQPSIEEIEKQEEEELRRKQERENERKIEVQKQVESLLEAEDLREKKGGEDENGNYQQENFFIDKDELFNQEEEKEKWKIRELLRIKKEKEEETSYKREQLEIKRRRKMNEEEKLKEDEKLEIGKFAKQKEKQKWAFLQVYRHKGVFFQDEDNPIIQRDISAPTERDIFDKSLLPKVLQVKNMGKKGRSKWTHLTDQDTTYLKDEKYSIQENNFLFPKSNKNDNLENQFKNQIENQKEKEKEEEEEKEKKKIQQKYLYNYRRGGDGNLEKPSKRKN
ncbi:microfibril-associated protein [Anaeramoeba ignava]|uniref:Microfibril-associated protein n=1 Tax=Anaeramoeba ignava TaxID=1746090 RepID=A0A9Q0LL77_ANAIG|nr:microfibril-associated protein [Anaeramoeba ignava]